MTNISLQPLPVNLQADTPTQIQAIKGGCTIVNTGSSSIQLCSDQNFSVPVAVPAGVSIPWSTGTTLWALSPSFNGSILVLPEPYNYYNPNVNPTFLGGMVAQYIRTEVLGGAVNIGVPTVASDVKTLIIDITGGNPITGPLTVYGTAGDGLDQVYYNKMPYLPYFGPSAYGYRCIVPVCGIPDSGNSAGSYSITFPGTNFTFYNVTVYADTVAYNESLFYNGDIKNASGAATQGGGNNLVLVSGPARILSAWALTDPSSAGVAASANGGLTVDNGAGFCTYVAAGAGRDMSTSASFGGTGLILPRGSTLQLQSLGLANTIVLGGCAYAYP